MTKKQYNEMNVFERTDLLYDLGYDYYPNLAPKYYWLLEEEKKAIRKIKI